MGVDLTLLPFDADFGDLSFAHSVLQLERRGGLWDPIVKIETARGEAVPEHFASYLSRNDDYEEAHYGVTTETPYGDRMKYVRASDLLAIGDHEGVTDNYKNRAVWAYLSALPSDTKVALYWH